MAHLAKIKELKDGQTISIQGWVHRLREMGKKSFLVIRNANGIIQTVVNNENIRGKLDVEASVKVKGKVKADERSPGGFEIQADLVEIIGESKPDWPFHRYKSVEMEMDYRHLWLRSIKMQNILKVRHTLISAARTFFNKHNFFEVHPPIFVSSACEGGSTLFEVPYFGNKAYLSQSAQLYLESFLPPD